MRLPWQKGQQAPEIVLGDASSPLPIKKVPGLREMSKTKANQSTGSYVIYDEHHLGGSAEVLKTSDDKVSSGSKSRKKSKKKDSGSSDEDFTGKGSKKDSTDDIKKKDIPASPVPDRSKRASLDVPSAPQRRASVDVSNAPTVPPSILEVPPIGRARRGSVIDSNSGLSSKNNLPLMPSPLQSGMIKGLNSPMGSSMNLGSSINLSSTTSSNENTAGHQDSHKKKPKKVKGKHAKDAKDGRRCVSFSMVGLVVLPDGSIGEFETNIHEPTKDEIPYHKRGKDEYKEKKRKAKLAKQLARANGELGSSEDDSMESEDDEPGEDVLVFPPTGFIPPVLPGQDPAAPCLFNCPHILRMKGPVPQKTTSMDGAALTLHSMDVDRFHPELKGVVVLTKPPFFDMTFKGDIKIKIQYLFDDWEVQGHQWAEKMDPLALHLLLEPGDKEKAKAAPVKLQNHSLGFLLNFPAFTDFLPNLYTMLAQIGMNTSEENFELDGVMVVKLTVYKSPKKEGVDAINESAGALKLSDDPLNSAAEERRKWIESMEDTSKDTVWMNSTFEVSFSVSKNPTIDLNGGDSPPQISSHEILPTPEIAIGVQSDITVQISEPTT